MDKIPQRAHIFRRKLEQFLRSKRMAAFYQEGLDRFLGEGREPPVEDERAVIEFLLFAHRDRSGRKLVDHYLEEKREKLGRQEQELFTRWREARFSFLLVEEVRNEKGYLLSVRLREAGTGDLVEVADGSLPDEVTSGMGVFAYLLPMGGHYELGGLPQILDPNHAYTYRRAIERLGANGLPTIADPVDLYHAGKESAMETPPAKNKLEAELQAAVVFSEIRFPLTVNEVQRRFQGMKSPLALLDEVKFDEGFEETGEFERFADVLRQLWNHTPRDEYGGKTPQERMKDLESLGHRALPWHLAEDLIGEISHNLSAERFADVATREDAKRAWFEAPQKELEGLSPNEILNNPLPPPPPPEEEALPLPDTPRWSREAVQAFLGSKNPGARFFALKWSIRERDPFPLEAAVGILDAHDRAVCCGALNAIRQLDGENLGPALPALRKALEDRLPAFHQTPHLVHGTALETLRVLQEEEALRACKTAGERVDLLLARIRTKTSVDDAWKAMEQLFRMRDRGAIARGTEVFLGRLARKRNDEQLMDFSPPSLLRDAFRGIGLGTGYLLELECLLVDCNVSVKDRSEKCGWVLRLLAPVADPEAAGRSSEVLGELLKERLVRLLGDGEAVPLCSFLEEIARNALALARVQNPSFAGLGEALEGILDGCAGPEKQGSLRQADQDVLAAVILGVLLKALQGRDLEAELKKRSGDPQKLLELLRVNDPWIEVGERELEAFADLTPSPELLQLAESPDDYVQQNALLVLAAIDPERNLDRLLDGVSWLHLPPSLARCAGDAILLPLARRFNRKPSRSSAEHLLEAIRALRTLRAGAYLDHYFGSLIGLPAAHLTEAVIGCGSRERVGELLHRLSRGTLECKEEFENTTGRDELIEQVEVLLAIHSLTGDPSEMVREGVARYETRMDFLREGKR